MERIDRRVPIKVIAQELGVSETRINQHIRALKDIFEAESLNELVETYRATKPRPADANAAGADNNTNENQALAGFNKGLSEAVYSKNQVPESAAIPDVAQRVDQGELVMNDAGSLIEQAPWLRAGELGEPKVVPGVLDGEHAILFRLAAIVGIGFGFLGALVLTLTAAVTISEALEGRAEVPVDEEGYT